MPTCEELCGCGKLWIVLRDLWDLNFGYKIILGRSFRRTTYCKTNRRKDDIKTEKFSGAHLWSTPWLWQTLDCPYAWVSRWGEPGTSPQLETLRATQAHIWFDSDTQGIPTLVNISVSLVDQDSQKMTLWKKADCYGWGFSWRCFCGDLGRIFLFKKCQICHL